MATKVSHTLTVAETSATTSPKLALNVEILKTKDGMLKFFETLLGFICMGMVFGGHVVAYIPESAEISMVFFFLCVMACLLPTFLILVSYIMSPMAAGTIPKMVYELLNNVVAAIFLILTSMSFLIVVAKEQANDDEADHGKPIAVAIIGTICLGLYLSISPDLPAEVGVPAMVLFIGNFPFLHTTCVLLLSVLISPMTANMLPKTVFEFLYHLFGLAFYLMSGLALLILASKHLSGGPLLEKTIALAVLALINGVLYSLKTHYSFRSYKEE